ncbi:unnamed protein product [Rhizophagus irregularis]|nr:unnamed protein product [Rhizophagus irregularis]
MVQKTNGQLSITIPKSQWSIHWNNVQKQVIFGKTLSQDTDRSTSISYLQHFIPQQTHHDNNLTPKKQLLGLIACKGCLLHSYYPHDTRPTYVIAIRTQKLLLFNIFKKSSFEYKSLLEYYNHQTFVVATKPFHTLRHIAYEHFIKIDKSPLNTSSQRPLDVTLTPNTSSPSNNIDNHIDHALICHPDLKIELKSCAKKLESEILLTFYTDGSVHIKVSKQQGNRIKKCNFIYLTIDIQQRNYPRLYSLGSIPCIECAYARDDNVHVGLCKEHSNQIINILTQAAHDLQELIITNTKDAGFDLDDTIRSSPLFNTTFDDILPQSHPGYLLIHHLVPSDLTLIFYNYIKDKKLRFSLFLKFFSTLMSSIDTLIWSRRASLIKQWESTLSITKNKKRFYRQRQKKRAPPPPAPDVSTQNSSPCRNYNHRHVATTPYYRDGVFHDHHAHIR